MIAAAMVVRRRHLICLISKVRFLSQNVLSNEQKANDKNRMVS